MVLYHARSESRRRAPRRHNAHRSGSRRLHLLWSGRFTRRNHCGLLRHSGGKFNSRRGIEGERELARHTMIEHGNNEATLSVRRDQPLVGNGDSHRDHRLCAINLLSANKIAHGCGRRGRGTTAASRNFLKAKSWQGNGNLLNVWF